MASGCSVRLPVAAAAGSVTPFDEKYALYGQPRAHWLRPWQGPRPLCSRDSTAVELQISWRSVNSFSNARLMCFSSAFISNGGCRICFGELRQARVLAAGADEALDVLVPRRDVRVADRPVDAHAFACRLASKSRSL